MDNAIIVSVPYRGYSFFNFPRLQTIYDAPDSKVSVPYRGYSFFNLNRIVYMDNAIIVSVPYRGYSFFNFPRLQTIYDAPDSKVSVPYRGYSFFNTPTKTSQTKQKQSVSVPYRGYSFFNLFLVSLYCLFLFPSLTGVIRFLIDNFTLALRAIDESFRPLQGLFVF